MRRVKQSAAYLMAVLLLALGGWGGTLVRGADAPCREARRVVDESKAEIAVVRAAADDEVTASYESRIDHHRGKIESALSAYDAAGCTPGGLMTEGETLAMGPSAN